MYAFQLTCKGESNEILEQFSILHVYTISRFSITFGLIIETKNRDFVEKSVFRWWNSTDKHRSPLSLWTSRNFCMRVLMTMFLLFSAGVRGRTEVRSINARRNGGDYCVSQTQTHEIASFGTGAWVCHPPARRLLSQAIKGGGARAKDARRERKQEQFSLRLSLFSLSEMSIIFRLRPH